MWGEGHAHGDALGGRGTRQDLRRGNPWAAKQGRHSGDDWPGPQWLRPHGRRLRRFLGRGEGGGYLATENGAGHLGRSEVVSAFFQVVLFLFVAVRCVRLSLHANVQGCASDWRTLLSPRWGRAAPCGATLHTRCSAEQCPGQME